MLGKILQVVGWTTKMKHDYPVGTILSLDVNNHESRYIVIKDYEHDDYFDIVNMFNLSTVNNGESSYSVKISKNSGLDLYKVGYINLDKLKTDPYYMINHKVKMMAEKRKVQGYAF